MSSSSVGLLGRQSNVALAQADSLTEYRRDGERAELISLVFFTCTVLFVTKAFIAWRDLSNRALFPCIWDDNWLLALGRTWLCCTEDFVVGLGCLLGTALGLRLLPFRGWRRVLRGAAHLAAALAISLMLINAQLFHITRCFLTYGAFQMGGGLNPERSLQESATLPVKLVVGLVPLAVLALHFGVLRLLPGWWRTTARWMTRPLGVLGALALVAVLLVLFGNRNRLLAERPGYFARNPHLLLVRTYFDHLFGGGLEPGETTDDSDFQPGKAQPSLTLAKAPTNIILIVLESGCANYLDVYGYELPTTPRLRRLADRSVIFDNCYATATQTVQSALPLQAGLYNDPTTWITVWSYPELELPSAALRLQGQGYRTYFLGAHGGAVWNHSNNVNAKFLSRGFDLARTGDRFWTDNQRPWPQSADDYKDADMFAEGLKCIDEARGNKFFLMMWNYDTHYDYYPVAATESFDVSRFPVAVRHDPEKREAFQRYLRSLRHVDQLIGDLVEELEKRGLAEETLIVVTGDHGEAFGQHGKFTHANGLFEEDVHVPLIFISPLLAGLGRRSAAVGSHIDVWPTIVDVCGLPSDPRWQGRSLFAPEPPDGRRAYFALGDSLGVREGRYKYIWNHGDNQDQGRDLLFDLLDDPGERKNLAEENQELCRSQRRRLRTWSTFQQQYLLDNSNPKKKQ